MKNRILCGLVALLATTGAHAADAPLPAQPLSVATPTKALPAQPRGVIPPTVSVTRVTRQRDGSLSLNCVQRRNPRLNAAASAQASGAQQP